MTAPQKHKYEFCTYNGRVKIRIDGKLFGMFNQIDFKGLYAFKDDTNLFGITLHLMNEKGGATQMDWYFKTRQVWEDVLKLLDENV